MTKSSFPQSFLTQFDFFLLLDFFRYRKDRFSFQSQVSSYHANSYHPVCVCWLIYIYLCSKQKWRVRWKDKALIKLWCKWWLPLSLSLHWYFIPLQENKKRSKIPLHCCSLRLPRRERKERGRNTCLLFVPFLSLSLSDLISSRSVKNELIMYSSRKHQNLQLINIDAIWNIFPNEKRDRERERGKIFERRKENDDDEESERSENWRWVIQLHVQFGFPSLHHHHHLLSLLLRLFLGMQSDNDSEMQRRGINDWGE